MRRRLRVDRPVGALYTADDHEKARRDQELTLWRAAREGDEPAYLRLVDPAEPYCGKFVLNGSRVGLAMGGIPPDRRDSLLDDAFAEAIWEIWSVRDRYEGSSRLDVWMYGVAKNTVSTRVARPEARHLYRRRDLDGDVEVEGRSAPSESQLVAGLIAWRVIEAVGKINPSYAEILVLVDMEGRSREDAARLMGISVTSAVNFVNRGRRSARRLLEEWGYA